MLDAAGVEKRYGDTDALCGVDLRVEAGEIVGLLGPNGAGKTTFVSIVAGLRRADAGQVTVDGIDVARDTQAARRRLGLAPQDLGVYVSLTVRENLLFFAELADLRGAVLRERIDGVAEALELTELLHRPARTLSGGEKRRLHTAMAMLHRPPLLLLDEPTTGVDVRTRAHLLEVVRDLAAAGTAVCYSTHYLAEVETLGASVAILDRGRMIARGALADLIRTHGTSAIELCFEGDAAPTDIPGYRTEVDGQVLRVFCAAPAEEAATVLAALGPAASALRSLDIVAPSLEAVFLALTGRRYDVDDSSTEEVPDVAVA